MTDVFQVYRPLIDLFLLHVGYALSQYIVLRAGMFSVANAAFAAIGAYAAAVLATKHGVPTLPAIAVAAALPTIVALVLSLPLARLRGVYQAIATLAFVQVVVSLNLYAETLTGGAMGLNGIPKTVGTLELLLAASGAFYIIWAMNRTRIGRAFEAVRQNEAMAASLGVSVAFHQRLAFAVSAALAGLFGGLQAFHGYTLEPNEFGFSFLVAILSYVVLGGRRSVFGPVVGTAALIAIPGNRAPARREPTSRLRRLAGGDHGVFAAWDRRYRAGRSAAVAGRRPCPGATMTSLALRSVAKRFGGVVAADDVTLDIPAGAVTGLIGPIGAGKTTIVNLITGMLSLSSGEIWLGEQNLTTAPAHVIGRAGVGRTFQNIH